MMVPTLPKVIPVNDLKNTAQIAKTCKESPVPIIITKNGYGEMVLMSIELYEQTMARLHLSDLINEAVTEIDAGAQPVEAYAFMESLKEEYGKE